MGVFQVDVTAPFWAIRFDAGADIGLGHWYRCVALAEELKSCGHERVSLWTNDVEPALLDHARARGLHIDPSTNWGDIDYLTARLDGQQDARLILDLMCTSVELVMHAKRHAWVISIGGDGEGRNVVDVRIDGMIPRPSYTDGYRGPHLFVGPEFVILRPYFKHPPAVNVSPVIRRVLIAMGGDASGIGVKVGCMMAEMFPETEVTVLVGPLAASGVALPESIRVHRGVENPRPIMERADIAIISGGMTGYELMRLGIPMLILPQVPHQLISGRAFQKAGVGLAFDRIAGAPTQEVANWLRSAIRDVASYDTRLRMSNTGRQLVDGAGAQRIVSIIESCSPRVQAPNASFMSNKGIL